MMLMRMWWYRFKEGSILRLFYSLCKMSEELIAVPIKELVVKRRKNIIIRKQEQ
jgi:hypothetical protein